MMIEYILNTSKTYHGYYSMTEYISHCKPTFICRDKFSQSRFLENKVPETFLDWFQARKILGDEALVNLMKIFDTRIKSWITVS